MTVFLVLSAPGNQNLKAAIEATFSGNHLAIRDGEWLIASNGTAREISDKLGITPGESIGSAMVFAVSGYYGRARTDFWEWIAAKLRG